MQVQLTGDMVELLKATPEIPDNLLAAVGAARRGADAFLVELNDDEAMAMVEMCQWYIKKDPATGMLTSKAALYDSIVEAVDDAQLA